MPKVKTNGMNKKVMFGAPLYTTQIQWLKQLATKTKSSASEVLRQVVDSAMVYSPKEFEEKLVKSQLQRQLEDVSHQLTTLARTKEEIESKLNG